MGNVLPGILLRLIQLVSCIPLLVLAGEYGETPVQAPIKYLKYYVNYELRGDGTYSERNEFEMKILTEGGLPLTKQLLIGLPNHPIDRSRRDVEVLNAFTLKRNGERVAAVTREVQAFPDFQGAPPAKSFPQPRQKAISFPGAEVGDTLVWSYKVMQKEPFLANQVVIEHVLPKLVAQDLRVGLSAPVSLRLRIETAGLEEVKNSVEGDIQKRVWGYQNKKQELPGSAESKGFDLLHISTFKDNASERESLNNLLVNGTQLQPVPEHLRCAVSAGAQNDGPVAMNMYAEQVAEYFWSNANQLERMVDEWNVATCVLGDGRPRMSALEAGLNLAFKTAGGWNKSQARIQNLKENFKEKPYVALAEAKYWIDYAWDARGTGYSSSVTPDGWRLFRERLETAERVLINSKYYAGNLPGWYDMMIEVQSLLGRPPEVRDKVFLEGVKKYKTYYPTYFTMLLHLSPKWGGNWEMVDAFVKSALENTRSVDGETLYARLYWVVYNSLPEGGRLFQDTRASWPKMKKGFEDLMARHPASKWNLNNFAKFACVAGDKKTFLALRRKMGGEIFGGAWSRGTTLELCEAKFGYQ